MNKRQRKKQAKKLAAWREAVAKLRNNQAFADAVGRMLWRSGPKSKDVQTPEGDR